MTDVTGGDEFEASLNARFGPSEETTPGEDAAPEPEAAEEPAAQAEPQPPLRDEAGKFTNDTKLLEEHGLTQFKSVADALKSYRELQGLQGRQAQEIGEIRQQLQEYSARLDNQPLPPVRYDDYDAAAAAQIAYERGDTHRFQQAMSEWKDEDPFAAAVWVADQKRQAELAQLREEYETRFAPVQKIQTQDEMTAAFTNVAARIPGIVNVDILGVAQESPDLLDVIQTGTQREREMAFENLYGRAIRRQAELAEAQTASQAAQSAEDRAAKAAAVVASSSSKPASAEGKDAIDRFKQSILGVETGLVDRFAQ